MMMYSVATRARDVLLSNVAEGLQALGRVARHTIIVVRCDHHDLPGVSLSHSPSSGGDLRRSAANLFGRVCQGLAASP